jgi:hypothetical protein
VLLLQKRLHFDVPIRLRALCSLQDTAVGPGAFLKYCASEDAFATYPIQPPSFQPIYTCKEVCVVTDQGSAFVPINAKPDRPPILQKATTEFRLLRH